MRSKKKNTIQREKKNKRDNWIFVVKEIMNFRKGYKKNCVKQLLGKIFVDVTFLLFFHKVNLTLIKSKAFMLDFINFNT